MTVFHELPFGLEWVEPGFMQRASHALAADERVWLVDPLDAEGLDERVAALGEPAGVVQLLDRHARDAASLAARYEAPLYVTPFDGVPGSPFEVLRVVDLPGWREAGLWWPETRTLVVADALGTARYFRASYETLAVHPFLRLFPPNALNGLEPGHVLCGHGQGVHDPSAAAALEQALRTARRRIPRWLVGLARRR